MKRRLRVFMLLLLLLCLATDSFFAQENLAYIFGTKNAVSDTEFFRLNEKASEVSERHDMDVFFLMVDDTMGRDISTYAQDFYNKIAIRESGILMTVTIDEWTVHTSGRAREIFSQETINRVWDEMMKEDDYYQAVFAYIDNVDQVLLEHEKMLQSEQQQSSSGETAALPATRLLPRLVDEAALLSESEAEELVGLLDEISERQSFDVAVVTVKTMGGKSAEAYADDFYDENGYGKGEQYDGAMLLVEMENRNWHISTHGFGTTAMTDAGLDYMSKEFLPDLGKGNYADSFKKFAQTSDAFVTQARLGEAYDSNNLPKGSVHPVWIPISMLIGLITSVFKTRKMKRELRSVYRDHSATSYALAGSLYMTENSDRFLSSNVDRVLNRSSDSDSGTNRGGGSTTHTSSSGRTHGGRGGTF